jgi:hypothetical protein
VVVVTCPRAVMLLTSDEPSEALMSFLGKKASLITRALFDVS